MAFESSNTDYEAVRDDWFKRSEKWSKKVANSAPHRAQRQRRTHPLIISGYGVSMQIHKGTLLIKDGFTHYPQPAEEMRFFPGDPAIPEKIILIDGRGGLSFAVLDWLREQGVTFVRIDWKGTSTTIVNGPNDGPNVEHLKWQLDQAGDPEKRLAFTTYIIRRKLVSSLEVLEQFLPDTAECSEAADKTRDAIEQLNSGSVKTVDAVRSLEGVIAKSYFRAWKGIELRWIKEKQHPVPPRWKTFKGRTSIANGNVFLNKNATHPINAMLNYAYALLEADIRIKVVSEGYHARIGIFHQRNDYAVDSFVFDLMEPERAKADLAVLEFAMGQRFSAKDFLITTEGVCRLSPHLGRALTLLSHRASSVGSTSPLLPPMESI